MWNILQNRVVRRFLPTCDQIKIYKDNPRQTLVDGINVLSLPTSPAYQNPTQVQRITHFAVSPFASYMLITLNNSTLQFKNLTVEKIAKPLFRGSFFCPLKDGSSHHQKELSVDLSSNRELTK